MPRTPAIKYAAYRRFDAARVEANDAAMALLVGSRLAAHLLAANAGSPAYLPEIYPAVAGIGRLHLHADAASSLLGSAETQLSSMAIPYVWATYEVLIESSIEILVRAGMRQPTRRERGQGVMGRHRYMELVTGIAFDPDDLALIDLVRILRNCIVHAGGFLTADVAAAWSTLTAAAESRWIGDSGRSLGLSGPRLDLLSGEVIGSLAITKHVARRVSALLGATVPTSIWAQVIVDDFLVHHPAPSKVVNDAPRLRKKVNGWNRTNYIAAGVTAAEIDTELRHRSL